MKKHLAIPLLLAGALMLGACGRDTPDVAHDDGGHGRGFAFIDGNLVLKADGHPSATITKDGGLLIDGKPVQLSPAQHERVQAYRAQIAQVADQGIAVGKQGAALGIAAASEALKGVLSGDTDKIGQHVETQAKQIKIEALKICDRLEGLRGAQDALVREVPAFAPYATLDAHSVAHCRTS